MKPLPIVITAGLVIVVAVIVLPGTLSGFRTVSNLQFRQGIAYEVGATTPFTGRVYIADPIGQRGKPFLEQHYQDGRLHGISRGYYHNGQIKYLEHWLHGERHGLFQTYKRNGELLNSENYENGISTAQRQAEQAEQVERTANQALERVVKSGRTYTGEQLSEGRTYRFRIQFDTYNQRVNEVRGRNRWFRYGTNELKQENSIKGRLRNGHLEMSEEARNDQGSVFELKYDLTLNSTETLLEGTWRTRSRDGQIRIELH